MATSQAGGTMTPTECTCSRRIATRTATWRTVQCATPRRTTPHSHSGSKPPLTMWTSIPPHGGLLTGQNSTRALPTLGYRLEQGGEGKRKRDYYGGHGTLAKKLHELFHMNFYSYVSLSVVIFFLLLSPFFIEKKSKVECGGRWNEIRWGEMESEPKKEFMECLLFLILKKRHGERKRGKNLAVSVSGQRCEDARQGHQSATGTLRHVSVCVCYFLLKT